ncbi:MAG: redoxin domain-containing protein [Proteobacteria bacterium]|nr:redoxin domain-containing protein [Pseudomonadota bacterium]
MRFTRLFLCLLAAFLQINAMAADAPYPAYKPASRAPAPVDIRTNAYGFSRSAPDALKIGDLAPEFSLPRAGGGTVSMVEKYQAGPTVLIFYRGHW